MHFSQLWAQHNEGRLLIPNIISIVVGSLSHFNMKAEMYLGAAFLAVGVFALIATMQGLTRRPWFVYAPAGVVMFTPVQWQSTLWGFEFTWFFILACLGSCVYVLCRFRSQWGLALAIALATMASVSSLQGLFLWPACGLL